METVMILITLLLAVVALFLAMTALAKVEELERERESRRPKKKPGRMRDPTTISDADLRKMAVLQKQNDNFMNYDGSPQTPIDESTILTESGK